MLHLCKVEQKYLYILEEVEDEVQSSTCDFIKTTVCLNSEKNL